MVQKLSSGFGGSDLVVELAKPLINRIGGHILWPLALATPQGCDMMVRIATDHDTPVAIDRYLIGFRTPMLHAPAGLCYLAFCEDGARASILNLVRRSSSAAEPQRDPDADLEFTLEQTRRLGYCHIRFAQYREGGLAVPVFADNRVVGGIVMRYMKASMKGHQVEERYVPILQKLADDISAAYDRRVNVADAAQAQDREDLTVSADDVVSAPAPFWISGTSPIRQGAAHQGRTVDGLHRASR